MLFCVFYAVNESNIPADGKGAKLLKRKLLDFGSSAYRRVIFPFKKTAWERRTESIIKGGAYLYNDSALEGKNYIGVGCDINHSKIGFGSYVNNASRLTNTVVGKYTSIGPEVVTVIGKHPMEFAAMHPAFCSKEGAMGYTYVAEDKFEETTWIDKNERIQIVIGNDVWIGNRVMIMEGVTIGDGAVIGAGAVVTKDVEPYSVYAGVPAKKIRMRFDDDTAGRMEEFKWWDKGEEWIKKNADNFQSPEMILANGD